MPEYTREVGLIVESGLQGNVRQGVLWLAKSIARDLDSLPPQIFSDCNSRELSKGPRQVRGVDARQMGRFEYIGRRVQTRPKQFLGRFDPMWRATLAMASLRSGESRHDVENAALDPDLRRRIPDSKLAIQSTCKRTYFRRAVGPGANPILLQEPGPLRPETHVDTKSAVRVIAIAMQFVGRTQKDAGRVRRSNALVPSIP